MTKFYNSGIVLISALCLMVLMLIIAISIVSLSTGNLSTVSSIHARHQALILASSSCMCAMYNLQSEDSNSVWAPGSMPSVPVLYFTEVSPDTDDLPGRCRVAYINNLKNPNNGTSVSAPSFYPSLTGMEIYGETAVIIGQGEYGGFKRTVKMTVKNTYFACGGEGVINIGQNGYFTVNGISSIENLDPGPCVLYGKKGINYNLYPDRCRFFNGSKLRSRGPIKPSGGYGGTVDNRFIEPNYPVEPQFFDWHLNNPLVTDGTPSDPNSYSLLTAADFSSTETLPAPVIRPEFASPSPDQCYVHKGPFIVNNNTFINGSLHIIYDGSTPGSLEIQNDSSLFINGVLIIEGNLSSYSRGNLYVAGYFNDPASSSADTPYGMSLIVEELLNPGLYTDNKTGLGIFTEGDVIVNSAITVNTDMREILYAMPEDVSVIKDTFNMFGLSGSDGVNAFNWFENSFVDSPPLLYWDITGSHILSGCPDCNNGLITKGMKPVPEEMSQWFNHPLSYDLMMWATASSQRWNTFKKNPSLYNNDDDNFLQAVIYTHGTLHLGKSMVSSVHLLGGVVAKNNPAISPNPVPSDPSKSHGGNINMISSDTCIIYYPEYYKTRSGKFNASTILNIYSWQEL